MILSEIILFIPNNYGIRYRFLLNDFYQFVEILYHSYFEGFSLLLLWMGIEFVECYFYIY